VTRGYLTYEVHRPPRWNTFFVGLIINLVGALLLLGIVPQFTSFELGDPISSSNQVTLVAPVIEHSNVQQPPQVTKLQSPKSLRLLVVHVNAPQSVKVETSKIETPEVVAAKSQIPKPDFPKFVSPPVPNPAVRQVVLKEVRTNVSGSETSATATIRRPARELQTGGFGDPNGVAGRGDPQRNRVMVGHAGLGDGVLFGGCVFAEPSQRSRQRVSGSGRARRSHPELKRVDKKPELHPVEIVSKPSISSSTSGRSTVRLRRARSYGVRTF